MRKIRKNRKMTTEDIGFIIQELRRWEQGDFGPKLTWEKIEKFTGFTKPALHAKPEIKEAFQKAKEILAKGGRKSVARQKDEYAVYLENKTGALQEELKKYKQLEMTWLAKWQRIAYHLKVRGISIEEVDQTLPCIDRH
jgi:hypothetical protein